MQTADQHVFIVSTHINATHTHTHDITHIQNTYLFHDRINSGNPSKAY